MSLRLGLIGCGIMGEDHARILVRDVPGAILAGIFDPSAERRTQVLTLAPTARVFETPEAMIADPDIDAVLIASPDATHTSLALAAIKAKKPALVEKPLGTTPEEARMVVDAEIAAGQRFVQVGFMRRFDPGYGALAQTVRENTLGAPLFLHCVHRNMVAPAYVTSDLVISNASVHEFDICRFVLGEEFAAISVTAARMSSLSTARRPLLLTIESVSGVVITLEAFLDAQYGYEVQADLVCETGTRSLSRLPRISERSDSRFGYAVDADWRAHFADAYRLQLRDFVRFAAGGPPVGSSAFDGYAASKIAVFGLNALKEGGRVAIDIGPKPDLYA